MQPGTGVGGHCIAVDPWFIVSDFEKEAKIIRNAREINNYKTNWVIEKIKSTALQFELNTRKKPVVALMGMAFKANIDDLRESPALQVAETLLSKDFCDLVFVEPNILKHDEYNLTKLSELDKVDIVAYLVAHKEFIDFKTSALELDFCGVKKNNFEKFI